MLTLKHQYHVLTPLGRMQQVPRLAKTLYHPQILWHVLMEDDLCFFLAGIRIHNFLFPRAPEGWHPAHWAINQFIEWSAIYSKDRYLILADDDSYADGFWEKLDAADGDLIVFSMERPTHGDLLEAKPENMRFCHVGGEQVCMTGELLRTSRFKPPYGGDWDFIEKLCEGRTPVFLPEAHVRFNSH